MRVNELVRYYAMCERALLYEWCLRKGEYSLSEEAECKFPMMIASMKDEKLEQSLYFTLHCILFYIVLECMTDAKIKYFFAENKYRT